MPMEIEELRDLCVQSLFLENVPLLDRTNTVHHDCNRRGCVPPMPADVDSYEGVLVEASLK